MNGRKEQRVTFQKIFQENKSTIIWVHAASLGEFEQGRPIIELLKRDLPEYKILLTFFSPSGYEIRKNYPLADWVFYLPWDTHKNASNLVQQVKPVIAIFIKYEFWYHYSRQLARERIPTLSVSSIFREEQLFFKSYGSFYRKILRNFSHFFVQNAKSKELLKTIGLTNVSVTGDTRFDRVLEVSNHLKKIPIAEYFKNSQQLMVVGSCWPQDFEILAPFINDQSMKFIIAPHEMDEDFLGSIQKSIKGKVVKFSKAHAVNDLAAFQVLIIDNVGMLNSLYQYGEFAYVGGGFGKGIHNILEPAAFGMPIFFGDKNYSRFQEAIDLIALGGAFEIATYFDLKAAYERLIGTSEYFQIAKEVTKQYVLNNGGATGKITDYCKTLLRQ